ncbi:LysR family transcriptional regulator [Streptomyces abyssalis]|uniref:LysR family transcriptional regulator n=1 Tax=Streptomyces abyssalis TaxID=933944 RepID=A0A1E7JMF2_9ACTN|nr:LysR family transcriptional regulator [Streptomyces abyssalis]OEU87570.1 LysR family transcriptional regulator [Streptomyces abyssalis]OEU89060.1 LysR family transcriptional regulator [Streptomyces abyssalis]
MIDLRRLTVLRAIAEYGTVTAAAGAVHLTPSAVSQQVRQLGKELGVVLLQPQGRRVRLTEAAHALLRNADAIEELWQRTEADLRATAEGEPSGVLRTAAFPSAASALLAPLAVQLHHSWPELTVRVREAEPLDCFDLLFSGDTDLAVVEAMPENPPLNDRRFDQRPLLDDPFDLLTTAGHPLAGEHGPALEELAAEPWILGMPFSGCSARHLVLAACRSAGFTPDVAHEAREWSLVAALVSHGLGVALVPRLAQLPPHLDLVRTPLTGRHVPSRRFLSVVRCGSDGHPAIAAALALLGELAAKQGLSVAGAGAGPAV